MQLLKNCKLGDNYYLTGFDLFILLEPCIMCAMALIHSRVRRVYYMQKNNFNGALNTKLGIHHLKSLNHPNIVKIHKCYALNDMQVVIIM